MVGCIVGSILGCSVGQADGRNVGLIEGFILEDGVASGIDNAVGFATDWLNGEGDGSDEDSSATKGTSFPFNLSDNVPCLSEMLQVTINQEKEKI